MVVGLYGIKTYLLVWIFAVVFSLQTYSQEPSSLAGLVVDELGNALPGSHVHHEGLCCVTNWFGAFEIPGVTGDSVKLSFTYIGYKRLDTLISVHHKGPVQIQLTPGVHSLETAVVKGTRIDTLKSRKNTLVDDKILLKQYKGSLMKSLENISGVHSMDIGAGASKPVIRGMSFNRVVVSENGIKQEGQQWGADHGLEMDAFAVESAEVVKGASAIEYGSDAIGGYIAIRNDAVPAKGPLRGDLVILGNTGNQKLGSSLSLQKRFDALFFKSRITYQSFADYRIPTDTIIYLTRKIPVHDRRLKNTAGEEFNIHLQGGYSKEHVTSTLTWSLVQMKSGFFPGSHGVPDLDRVRHDGDFRDIDYPYQQAGHMKVLQNNKFFINSGVITLDLGFQSNHRQEWSRFHTHYPEQDAPAANPDLELDFSLLTGNINAGIKLHPAGYHTLSAGIQNQWKVNSISGYSFLLPEYSGFSNGIFLQDRIKVSSHLELHAAVRFDYSRLEILPHFDDVVYDYMVSGGSTPADADTYALRSRGLNREFADYSFLLGGVITPSNALTSRFNVGKAFRIPTAMELASNGVHHGSFRHEAGDPALNSEKGYYADANTEWSTRRSTFILSSYGYYFPNYIFLNPSGSWSELPHAGQIYRYSQSEALFAGFEVSVYQKIYSRLRASVEIEYIYNRQLSDYATNRYPLPFTPPLNGFFSLEQLLVNPGKKAGNIRVTLTGNWAMDQNRVARNELTTPGYIVFGARVTGEIKTARDAIQVILSLENAFDQPYFNHFSFYRRLEIPEQGRILQLLVQIPLETTNLKHNK